MARTKADFQQLAEDFARIAESESDKWHPAYYAALCYINMSFVSDDADERDSYLDEAQKYIDKALEIYPDESELLVLQGLLYQGRIQVDPAGRGMTYSSKAAMAFNHALQVNPDNPRAYYLMGLNTLHTPESYGGGAEAACSYFKTAAEKFRRDIPENVLSPTWGGERNQKLLAQTCGN